MATATDKKPDFNLQVRIGQGRSDIGALHRAIHIGVQLFATGRWPEKFSQVRLIVNCPYEIHRRISLNGYYNADFKAIIYSGVNDLVEGKDYEFQPLPADFWRMHGLPDPEAPSLVEVDQSWIGQQVRYRWSPKTHIVKGFAANGQVYIAPAQGRQFPYIPADAGDLELLKEVADD